MPKPKSSPLLCCPGCRQSLADYATVCDGCQRDLLREESRSDDVLARSVNRRDRSVFYNVSVRKMIIMWIGTLGVYQIVWFYKNWCYVSEHCNKKVFPLMSTVFAWFTCYELVGEIVKAGRSQKIEFRGSAGTLAVAFLAASLLQRASGVLILVGLVLCPVSLIPVQRYINSLNTFSSVPPNDDISPIDYVYIAVVLIFCLVVTVLVSMHGRL